MYTTTSTLSASTPTSSSDNCSQELTYNQCVGKGNYSLSKSTNWYGKCHKPISEYTLCEYCRKHLVSLPADSQDIFKLASFSDRIDCDSISEPCLTSLTFRDFEIKVVSADGKTPYLVHPEKAFERRVGLFVVEMPKIADYAIKIIPKYPYGSNLYYTYEMSVGDRKVIVNNGQTIYYKGETTVLGFSTGTTESFKFVAEEERPNFASARGINELGTNKITIKINLYKRETPYPFHALNFRSGADTFGSSRGGYKEKSSRDVEMLCSRDDELLCSRDDELLCSRDDVNFMSSSNVGSVVTGGSTITGGKSVSNVSTVHTNDKFAFLESSYVSVQLIHVTGSKYQARLDKAESTNMQAELQASKMLKLEQKPVGMVASSDLELQNTTDELNKTKSELQNTTYELIKTKSKLRDTNNELSKTKEVLQNTTDELKISRELNSDRQYELSSLKLELNKNKSELRDTNNELSKTKEVLQNTTDELNKTKSELDSLRKEMLDLSIRSLEKDKNVTKYLHETNIAVDNQEQKITDLSIKLQEKTDYYHTLQTEYKNLLDKYIKKDECNVCKMYKAELEERVGQMTVLEAKLEELKNTKSDLEVKDEQTEVNSNVVKGNDDQAKAEVDQSNDSDEYDIIEQ
jgi:hypothetical protein